MMKGTVLIFVTGTGLICPVGDGDDDDDKVL
jgi:hypothetical protein